MRSSWPTERPGEKSTPYSGVLFVVATPIGHMEDITLRGLRTLKEASLIAAEDTRQTRKLLEYYEIYTPVISYHDYNKEKRAPELLKKLKDGISIALVTDGGTPCISDPGYYLVKEAIRKAVVVVPIPGASAMVAALSASGLPTDSFVFVGFVPKRATKRKQLLNQLKGEPRTLVFYESPKRLLHLMREIHDAMGDRQGVIARELTKVHEEILRGPLSHILEMLVVRPCVKGECTLLVSGREKGREVDRQSLADHLRQLYLETDRPLSHLVKEVARHWGVSRKIVYEEGLKLRKKG